jgi:hypothetical protein
MRRAISASAHFSRCGGIVALGLLLLAACGPQLGELERGETGRVTRVFNGDSLELDNGLVVFLA